MTDSIPQLSLGTAALVIFLLCAGFVLLRGMTRMLVATALLALSAWVGLLAWNAAPALSVDWFGASLAWFTTAFPAAAFLSTLLVLWKLCTWIASPFSEDAKQRIKAPFSMALTMMRLGVALIPAALLCLIGAGALIHFGSVAEVRDFAENPSHKASQSASWLQNLRSSLQQVLPESLLNRLDPLAEPSRVKLAKLIAAQAESTLEPVIDPATGQAIPRAIIVDDPELQELARNGKFGALLRHPLLTKALKDPKVQALLKEFQL
jgi:hypothetical protein